MAINDKKKVQSLINLVAEEVEAIKASADRLEALRTKYVTQSVDATGTPLAGNVSGASNWIDSVRAVADAPIANGFLAHRVLSHRGKALDG